VFFNLFSEAESFAAITCMIAHGTHVFLWRGNLEAQRPDIRGRLPRAGSVLGEGQRAPSSPARVWESAVLSQRGPDLKYILYPQRA